jgi:hypothetical protein
VSGLFARSRMVAVPPVRVGRQLISVRRST